MYQKRRFVTYGTIAAVITVWLVALALIVAQPELDDNAVPTLAQFDTLTPLVRPVLQPIALSGQTITQTPVFVPDTSLPAEPSTVITAPREPVPNEVILHFEPDTSAEERANYIESIGGTVSKNIPVLNTVVVTVTNPAAPLPASPIVIVNEPDYYVSALSDSNDPLYTQQWGLNVVGAPAAWDGLPANTAQITVAVIDSGICADHPDLSGRIAAGWDFVQNDVIPQDDFGHGCAVAGIIAANVNNNIGIAGVAPNTQIMPIRVLDGSGIGRYSDVAAALVYAADSGANIINLSLGGYSTSSVMQNAVNYATSKGALVIAAAGNTGTQTVLYPAAYPSVIAVGAVNQNLQAASFSSYGPNVDIWAPGQGIITTNRDGGYATLNGTSFAAPHVAGVAALEIANGRQLIVNGGIVRAGSTSVVSAPTNTPEAATPTLTLPANTLPQLFLDTDTQGAQSYVNSLGVLRTRYVEVNFNALPADSSPQAQAASSPRIALNLFDDVQLTAVSDKITPRLLESDGLIWTGRIEGMEYGEVVFVVGNNQIEGHVSILGRLYQITYAGNGVHSINEIDPVAFKLNLRNDAVRVPPSQTVQSQPIAQEVYANVDDGKIIDILVVYTANAKNAAGGASNINSMIQAAVVATNKSYANSGVIQRLRLRTASEVVYSEQPSDYSLIQPLTRLATIADEGGMGLDPVHNTRDLYRADLVLLIVKTTIPPVGGVCGLGYMPTLDDMTPNDLGGWGFSVVAYDCLAGGITFAHELGHNMGSNHDFDHGDGQIPAYPHSYGYRDPDGAFADVMSYTDGCPSPCPVINYWSNQTLTFGGRAMGNATADNVTSLNNTASKIALYRFSEVGGPATPVPTATPTVQPTVLPGATSTPPDSPSGCSFTANNSGELISHINTANSNGSGNDTICLNADITLTSVNNATGLGNNGLPRISSTITIRGNGANRLITRSSASEFRHFYVDPSAHLILDNVTLTNGNSNEVAVPPPNNFDIAGSILVDFLGNLTITNSTVSNNESVQGGAIANLGTVLLNNVTLTNNRAIFGGGILNYSGALSILNSKFSGNISQDGGAIYNWGEEGFPSTINITGSVITENSSVGGPDPIFGDEHGGSAIANNAPTGSTTIISNSCIFNNANFALYVLTGTPGITAEQNWWGSPHGPTVNGKIAGDMVSSGIDFDPFRSVQASPCTTGPANNLFTNRFVITALPYLDTQNTTFAGVDPSEQTPSCVSTFGRSVWYSYAPASDEIVWIRTNASDFDTVVSVWTGDTLGGLNEVECDNDSGPTNRSNLVLSLTGGTTYQIMVAGNGGAVGNMVLHVARRPTGDIIVVDNSGNDDDPTPSNGICATATGVCTLRAAITTSNSKAGTQTIIFDIQNVTGTGPFTIAPLSLSQLPLITDTVIIDATTQFGYVGQPVVELNGENAGGGANGLQLSATSSTIRGFVINRYSLAGIQISGNNNVIEHNFIGTDVTGTLARANTKGIVISANGNTIGGTNVSARNLISGNSQYGIEINTGGTSNVVIGNYIGTNLTGTAALANSQNGVFIANASSNTVGGITGITTGGACTGACNVISGNSYGVVIGAGSTSNTIMGNFIGTNANGTVSIPNLTHGIELNGNSNTVGGTTIAERNVISGNATHGVHIGGSTGNVILGNFIGIDTSGALDLGNNGRGIFVDNTATNNTIGPANVISGNNNNGITFDGLDTANNTVIGNFIGTNASGTAAIPNTGAGVQVTVRAHQITIGGMTPADRNVISGNTTSGVTLTTSGGSNFVNDNTVQGNYIGTDITGALAIPNGEHGVFINDAINNTIGGTVSGAGNLIAFNTLDGVAVVAGQTQSTGNRIWGNTIFSNGGLGIDLANNGVTLNDVNDTDTGANNLQNFPVFTGAGSFGGSATFSGILTANADFHVEFFANVMCDSTGHGEGQTYIGFDDVTTDGSGNFSATISATFPANQFITMTATDINGNTSEFSKCPPPAPTNLDAVAINPVRIDLTWTDNTNNETNVYVERSLDGLTGWTQIASLNPNTTSYQNTGLVCDTTYYYRVRTFNNVATDYSGYSNVDSATTLACAPNNDLADAEVFFTLPDSDTQNSLGASTEAGETTASCALNATATLWYSYIPPSNQTVWFDTTTADFDTVISVWTGSGFPLTPVGCDNNSGPNGTSFLSLSLIGGIPYHIAVAGHQGAGGNFTLKVQIPPAPTPAPSATPVPTATDTPPDTTSRIGLFKNGTWLMSNSFNGGTPDLAFKYGTAESGWLPIVGDWDGDLDQVDTIGLYREGRFWLRDTNAAGFSDNYFTFGPQEKGWLPIAGDWDGDGIDTIGLYKNGHFGLRNSNSSGQADYNFIYGPAEAGWLPIAGDWDGDGIDTVGLYKDGHWRLRNSNSKGQADIVFNFGTVGQGWLPVIGDWDTNGTDTIGLYRNGQWWLRNSNSAGAPDLSIKFGPQDAGWQPVTGRWDGDLPLGLPITLEIPAETPTFLPTATLAPSETAVSPPSPTTSETATLEPPTFTPTETPTLEPSLTPSPTLTATEVPAPDETEPASSP